MRITYRRTGGVLAVLLFATVAVVATVLTIAVAATVLVVVLAIAAAALAARAVLPSSWWRRSVPPGASWPGRTIDTSAIDDDAAPAERKRLS